MGREGGGGLRTYTGERGREDEEVGEDRFGEG